MRNLNGIIAITVFVLGISTIKAQLDTLKYLKELEENKIHYNGKKFSKLYRDFKIIPKMFSNNRSGINFQTEFYIDKKRRINIVWMSSNYNKSIPLCDVKQCLFTKNEKNKFLKFKIKDIYIEKEGFEYTPHLPNYKPIQTPKEFINKRLLQNPINPNTSFSDFLFTIRPFRPTKVINNSDKKSKIISTDFTFNYNVSDQNSEIMITILWINPIHYKDLKTIKNNKDLNFLNEYYDLYWNRVIKNVTYR